MDDTKPVVPAFIGDQGIIPLLQTVVASLSRLERDAASNNTRNEVKIEHLSQEVRQNRDDVMKRFDGLETATRANYEEQEKRIRAIELIAEELKLYKDLSEDRAKLWIPRIESLEKAQIRIIAYASGVAATAAIASQLIWQLVIAPLVER